jgi:diadenylate cyclase
MKRSGIMSDFDILVYNIYLLAIFTILVKTKTITQIYRLFKLLNVALFIYLIVIIVQDNIPLIDVLIKGVPLILLIGIIIQTEVILLLNKLGLKKNSLFSNTLEDNIKIELIKSIDHLSGKKIGALITFEKNTSMDEYIGNAFKIGAPLNSELLSSIFYPNTPLHDGAVIIRRNKIVCAGAYYPPTERLDIPKQLGSRHRAAIGISEISDSLTIIVSEETGNISISIDGYLDLDISKESLLLYLEKHLQN